MNKHLNFSVFILFLLSLSFSSFTVKQTSVQQSLIVYPTFDHYLNDGGIIYEGGYSLTGVSGSIFTGDYHYKFKDKNQKHKVKVKASQVWGIKWGQDLYRMGRRGAFLRVIYQDTFCYYEGCNMVRGVGIIPLPEEDPDKEGDISEIVVSETLNSTLYAVKSSYKPKRISDSIELIAIFKLHDDGEEAYNCIKEEQSVNRMRDCILSLE